MPPVLSPHTGSRGGRSSIPALLGLLLVLSASAGLIGSAHGQTTPRPLDPADMKGVQAAERAAQSDAQPRAGHDNPPAYLNGQPVPWTDLQEVLAEAAGGQALQEVVLDRLLAEQTAARGIVITPADTRAERELLLNAIARDARANPDGAERLLDSVRRSRGLGEVRFAALLDRNARLRRLVAPSISVSDEEVAQAFQMLHGPRYRARVIVVPTHQLAAALRDRLLADEANIRANFIALAASESVDPSGARGGAIDPISPVDPQYPASVRDAAAALAPGKVSAVLPVDQGFAVLLLEEAIPPDGVTLDAVSDTIRTEVRLRRERLAMEDLARRLLKSAQITIPDRSLEWSWRGARAGLGEP